MIFEAQATSAATTCAPRGHLTSRQAPAAPRCPTCCVLRPQRQARPRRLRRGRIHPAEQSLAYTIRFENKPDATAPAQAVLVTDVLDPDLDLDTFELTEITFAGQTIAIPAGLDHYEAMVQLRSATASRSSPRSSPALDRTTRELRHHPFVDFESVLAHGEHDLVRPRRGHIEIQSERLALMILLRALPAIPVPSLLHRRLPAFSALRPLTVDAHVHAIVFRTRGEHRHQT